MGLLARNHFFLAPLGSGTAQPLLAFRREHVDEHLLLEEFTHVLGGPKAKVGTQM